MLIELLNCSARHRFVCLTRSHGALPSAWLFSYFALIFHIGTKPPLIKIKDPGLFVK